MALISTNSSEKVSVNIKSDTQSLFNYIFLGIPFVSLAEEEKLRCNLLEKYEMQELNDSLEPPEIPAGQKTFVEDVL